MEDEDIIEELLIEIEGAANMVRGIMFDANIHNDAKDVMRDKIDTLDKLVDKYA